MTILNSIVLGIVEGITEFLPISSTGHLVLASKILNIFQSDFVKSFEIIIQFGAILAVVLIYRRKIVPFDLELWKKVITSFVPTVIVGFILYKLIKSYLIGNVMITVWALIIGGIVIIAFEKIHGSRSSITEDRLPDDELKLMSYKKAFLIGLCQSIAVIPGVSRAAATIIGGQALGLSRYAVVEYSFLLAIPTMLAAAGYDFLKSAPHFVGNEIYLLIIGFIVSFITAFFVVKWLLRFIQTHDFTTFGIYRILIGLIFLFFV